MEFNAMEASAKECLAYYQAKLDEEAWEAKKNGKLVCCCAIYSCIILTIHAHIHHLFLRVFKSFSNLFVSG